jgi:galactokinase
MTGTGLAASLEAAGYDQGAAQSRAAWLLRSSAELERLTGQPPHWRWCVPGRIEIFGKHTDYAGGRSLLSAVPRGFVVAARPRTDGRVRVIDARNDDAVMLDPLETARTWRGWANYVAVTARRLARDFPGAALGTDIAVASDLPRAAGLSSSSALVVGIALALVRRGALDIREDWRQVIGSREDLAWYLGCVENGLTYKQLAHMEGVGTLGGSQDHTAILACRPGVVSQYGFMPVLPQGVVAMPADWRFVVASSGVHADKAGSVRDRFNRASRAVRALLDIWNEAAPEPAASLAQALATGSDAEARLGPLLRQSDTRGFAVEDLERRLSHFIRENARVPAAARAFEAGDRGALGDLALASQDDAERLLGNQIPETIALAAMARQEGAFAASAFGAGFGGSVWALVSASEADAFGRAWLGRFRRAFPYRETADWFTAAPGPGACEIPPAPATE